MRRTRGQHDHVQMHGALAFLVLAVATMVVPQSGYAAPRLRPPASPAPPAPPPGAVPDLRRAVEARLRAVETPPGADELKVLGAGVPEALLAIAADPKAEILVRARATSALGFFPSAVVRERLLAMLAPAGPEAPPATQGELLLARKAAMALGWQAAGVKEVAGLLEHGDADVRIDAAFALGLTRLPAAAERLRVRSVVEKDTRVQRQIERQLRVLDEAIGKAGGKTGNQERGKGSAAAGERDRGPRVVEPQDPRGDPVRRDRP